MFGEVRVLAPDDEGSSIVGEDLKGALGRGDEIRRRWGVGLDFRGGEVDVVDGEDYPGRLRAGPVVVVAGVVEEGEQGMSCVLGDPTSMMLVRKGKVRLFERRTVPPELPDDVPVLAGHLVHRAHVSGREEVVSISILVDRVEVEVVPGRLLGQTIPGSVGRAGQGPSGGRIDMIERTPFEDQSSSLDVDFLEHAFDDPAESIADVEARIRRQVIAARLIDGHQRGGAVGERREFEFVHVTAGARAGALDGFDDAVGLVHDHAVAAREAFLLFALEEAEVVGALVRAYSRSMGGFRTTGAGAGPDEVAIVVVDVWCWVEIAVGCEEDVARRDQFWLDEVDGQDRSM